MTVALPNLVAMKATRKGERDDKRCLPYNFGFCKPGLILGILDTAANDLANEAECVCTFLLTRNRRVLLRRRRKGRLATSCYLWGGFLRPLFPYKLATLCEL